MLTKNETVKMLLSDLTKKSSLPQGVTHSHIGMYTIIHLPTFRGYQKYTETYDVVVKKLLSEAKLDNYSEVLIKLLDIEYEDKEYFCEGRNLTQKAVCEVKKIQKEFIENNYPMLDFSSFKKAQINAILTGLDRPIYKLFCYLLLLEKVPYSSNGYGDAGELTFFESNKYPYGVSWEEGQNVYRGALVEDKIKNTFCNRKTC
jgi:hypothetical protein